MEKDSCFNLGYIVKTVGLKGEVSIFIDSDNPEHYKKLESVFVELNKQLVPFFISSLHLKQKGFATVKFDGIDTETQALQLVKCALFLPLTKLPALGENDFYYHEVRGFTISDQHAGNLGMIDEVLDYGHTHLAQVMINGKEVLVPLQKIFLVKTDRKNKILFMNLPEGLIDVYLDDNSPRDDE